MALRALAACAALFTICCPSGALAWGNDVSRIRQIYSDRISIRLANGHLGTGVMSIVITATTFVGERGTAKWPDDRACYYNDVRITLVRSLTLNMPDGTSVPVRDTTVTLPNQAGKSWGAVTTCNDKIGEIEQRLENATGNAEQWSAYIDGQKAEVRKILKQFGQII